MDDYDDYDGDDYGDDWMYVEDYYDEAVSLCRPLHLKRSHSDTL